MAIQVQTQGATDLRLAADIVKPNYAVGRTIGGQAGRVMGHWRAVIVRLPAAGFTLNGGYVMLGRDNAGTTNFQNSNDSALRIFGGAAGGMALRPFARYRNALIDAFAGSGGAEGQFSTVPALTATPAAFLVIEGITNTGTNASPVWKGWGAICQIGSGSPASQVAATDIASGWITGTTGTLLRQIFAAAGTGSTRTPAGVALEQAALVAGDFPWDTANNRPHHDAIAALAGVGGNPFLTYETLVAAQNAGTLPYANCDQGLGNLDYWWSLRTLAGGLANSGTVGSATLAVNAVVDSSGLTDGGDIAPAHWYGGAPTISDPLLKFTGGRGTRPTVVGGSRQSGQTVERRWERMSDGAALAGLDWAVAATQSGTSWQTSDTLPIGGPYRLRVRNQANPDQASASEDWLAGTVITMHGQSGMDLAFYQGSPPGTNHLGIAVASGAQGLFLKLNNQDGGTASVYAQPTPVTVRMRSGETPAMGHGAVLFLNEWHSHNPGHPLLICPLAIAGTGMSDWANNTTVNGGHASWTFMGTIGAVAGPASGNGSGVVETCAALLGRWTDAHMLMWTPGMSSLATGAGSRALYLAGVDERFSNAASAPFIILPPWRGQRQPPDESSTVAKRQEHLDFVAELGPRGVLGPYWPDIVSDLITETLIGSLHSAFRASITAADQVLDINQVGQARLGRGLGRTAAWHWDRTIKAHGARVLAAWSDNGRATVQIELGRVARTLNGAAISANQFWVSLNNGSSFGRADGLSETLVATGNPGFTVALDATGTRAILTPADGGTAWAAAGANLRVDYARRWPFGPSDMQSEANAERNLDGLLYDDQTYRGGTNFAAGVRPGNPLQGTNRTGVGLAGVPVTARGAAKLVATERWTGSRNVTVRMMAADGVTVLREKTLAVAAN